MIIPLRAKYRSAHRGTYRGGERPAEKKRRNKLSDAAKRNLAPQPKVTLVVDGLTGKSRLVRS